MSYASLEIAIIRHPAVVSVDAQLFDAIAQMSGTSKLNNINVTPGSSRDGDAGCSYLVIVDGEHVVGLLTERDVVRFAAQQLPLKQLTLRQILKKVPFTVKESTLTDLSVVLDLFAEHQLSYLPILDDAARLAGVISRESLQQMLSDPFSQTSFSQARAFGEKAMSFVGAASDIGDRRQAESLLEDQSQILEKIAKAEPLQNIFQSFLTAMETYLPTTACSIILCQSGHLCHLFAPSLPQDYIDAVAAAVLPIAEGVGSCGTAAHRQAMVISKDIATDPLWQDFKHLVVPYGLKSCWSMPVFGQNQQVLGVFDIYSKEKGAPQPSEIEFVSKLANLAGIAIEREQSTQALKQLNQKLEDRVEERTAALQASEERWQLALKGANEGLWDWNLKTNQLFVSPRFKAIHGYENDNFPDDIDEYLSLIHPDDQAKERQAVEEHLAGNSEFFQVEYRIKHKKGDYIWISSRAQAQRDSSGRAIRMIGSETDITQRKTAEQALIVKQTHLEALLNNIPHMAWIKDEQSRFIAVNQPFSQASGKPIEAHIGKTDFDLWPAKLAQAYRDDDFQVLKSSECKVVEELVVRSDGTTVWIETTKTPFIDAHGELAGTVGIAVDITERKRIEAALAESEAQFRRLVEGGQELIWSTDEQGRFTYLSPQFKALSGWEAREWIGKNFMEAVWPGDQEWVAACHQILANEASTLEFRLTCCDRSYCWVSMSLTPVFNTAGDYIGQQGTIANITERKTAELALQVSEAKFKRITESVPGAIFQYVLHPDGRDEFIYISPHIQQIYELAPEAVLQNVRLMWDRIHPDDVGMVSEAVQVSAASLQPFFIEMRLRFPQGRIKWVQIISQPERQDNDDVVWDGVILEVSDRKQAEEKLKVVSERLKLALKSAEIGIWEWNSETNTLIWDDRMFALYGIASEDFSGNYEDWLQHLHPEDVTRIKRAEEAVLRGPGSVTTEFRIVRPNGEIRFIYSNVSTLRTEQGKGVRTIGLDMDITERKQAEADLKRTNQELARATRLKDEFLANMSHELRTPLNAILGMAEGLQENVFGQINEQQLNALTTIEKSGSHLLELINEVLDLAKIEAGNIELAYSAVSITHLCQSSLTFIKQQSLEKGVQLHLQTPWDLPTIRVDERRIRQVLINLLNNAVKFTPSGGTVTLTVALSPPDKPPQHPHSLRFAVCDTGIGIHPDELNQLFQPFVQIDSALNRQYEGTGLGLALVKRIVELHGGQVSVTSTVGVGSCFTIELPYNTAAQQGTPSPKAMSGP